MNQAAALPRLPAATPGRFAPSHRWDHNFFATVVALIWLGILAGFVPQIDRHFVTHAPAYPQIIHFHAAAFVGWLVLLTVQLWLVRAARLRLHRRLGVAGAVLAAAMLILGPAAALTVDGIGFKRTGEAPIFLAIQLTDMVAFGGLIVMALVLRSKAPAHKRLVLLATLYISDAGFARWLDDPIESLFGHAFWGQAAGLYLASDLVVVTIGGYDLITRGRPHPTYIAGMAWTVAMQCVGVTVMLSTWWPALSVHLIGK